MDTKNALLDAALARFAAYGYDGSGVQEICDDCGLTKPTLYHHFGSKFGLLEALLAARFQALWPALETAAAYRHDLTLNLEQVLRAYFYFAAAQPVFYRLQLALRHAPVESDAYQAFQPQLKRQEALLTELFEAAAGDHGNMRGRARAFTLSFLGMLNAYISQALDEGQSLDQNTIYQARQQFMYGIFS